MLSSLLPLVDLWWVWMGVIAGRWSGSLCKYSVEPYGVCKEFDKVRESRQIWKERSLMMGQ